MHSSTALSTRSRVSFEGATLRETDPDYYPTREAHLAIEVVDTHPLLGDIGTPSNAHRWRDAPNIAELGCLPVQYDPNLSWAP